MEPTESVGTDEAIAVVIVVVVLVDPACVVTAGRLNIPEIVDVVAVAPELAVADTGVIAIIAAIADVELEDPVD